MKTVQQLITTVMATSLFMALPVILLNAQDTKEAAKDAVKEAADDTAEVKEAEEAGTDIQLGDGKLTMTVPTGWEKVEPRSRIVEVEFKIPKAEGDEQDGRLTMMAASGGVKANIDRWVGQFTQKDGSETKAKTEEKMIDGMTVNVVDISGNFMDSPRGPFGPKVERESYRMLAAIVETGTSEYYLKLYGPAKTIGENDKKFKQMVESFKGKE